MASPIKSVTDPAERGKEQLAVTIRLIDMLPPVTAQGDVRKSPSEF